MRLSRDQIDADCAGDDRGRKFGMQLSAEANELFALNIARWLARLF
jgi:hypothetical protein